MELDPGTQARHCELYRRKTGEFPDGRKKHGRIPVVDYRHPRTGDPADRADLAGDAAPFQLHQRERPRQVRARSTAKKSRAGARELTTSERGCAPTGRRTLVRNQGLATAPSPARNAGACAAGPKRLAGRRNRLGKDARWLSSDDLRACRTPTRRASHALCFAAEGTGSRRPAQPASDRSRRWGCRFASRPAPATRHQTARLASGLSHLRFC